MARGVNHESTPLELWSIDDLDGQASYLPFSLLVLGEELGEGLETSHESRVVISGQFPGMGSVD